MKVFGGCQKLKVKCTGDRGKIYFLLDFSYICYIATNYDL